MITGGALACGGALSDRPFASPPDQTAPAGLQIDLTCRYSDSPAI
jgi:hypothetical protein